MIAAVIFDLDGTVLDNEPKWEESFRKVANSHTLEYGSKWIHTPGVGVLANWEKMVGKGELAIKLTQETVKLYRDENSEVEVRPGLIEAVEYCKKQGWWTGLATGSEWVVVEKELEELNLYLAFDVTTTGEEVDLQKPDPQIFTLTLQKMGVEPGESLIIEDSTAGVVAGVAAGCSVVAIASEYASSEDLLRAGAKQVVDNLAEAVIVFGEYGDKKQ